MLHFLGLTTSDAQEKLLTCLLLQSLAYAGISCTLGHVFLRSNFWNASLKVIQPSSFLSKRHHEALSKRSTDYSKNKVDTCPSCLTWFWMMTSLHGSLYDLAIPSLTEIVYRKARRFFNESSALSMHARSIHGELFNLNNFKISLIKKWSPQKIRREEFKYIDRFKTRTFGINRYKN